LGGSAGLSDDLGTDYESQFGGSSAGDGGPLHGDLTFTPAVPVAATRLIIEGEEGAVEVELPPPLL
jgi:hypothetical protein